jgi:hypothetical protein
MIRGAQPVLTPNTYNGLWFERPDGTRFGLRLSAESGPTIDIFKSNDPLIRENFKVHRR